MGMWEEAEEMERRLGQSQFLKLEDGDRAKITFLADTLDVGEKWFDRASNQFVDHAPSGEKTSFRFSIQIFNHESQCLQLLEGSGALFRQILKKKSKKGLDNQIYTLERDGTGLKTKYDLDHDGPCSHDDMSAIRDALGESSVADPIDDDGIPF